MTITEQEYKSILKNFNLKTVFNGGNIKLKKANTVGFSLPAYESQDGFRVCPNAGDCKHFCYAKKGNFRFPNIKANFEKKLKLTLSGDFVKVADYEIKLKNYSTVRIHDSGDFYSLDYLRDWVKIASMNPNTIFYAYTKSHLLLDKVDTPSNLIIIKSIGANKDFINPDKDRHARIFDSVTELLDNGYNLAFLFDTLAWSSDNHRVGLLKDFKTNLYRYAREFAQYHNNDVKHITNLWIEASGSRKKPLV